MSRSRTIVAVAMILGAVVALAPAATARAASTLQISIEDSVDPARVGEPFTYVVTVRNSGNRVANDVRVTDALPSAVSFVSATPSQGACSGAQTVECSFGSLAKGATARVDIVVNPQSPGSVTNTAGVRMGGATAPSSTATAVTDVLPARRMVGMTFSLSPSAQGVGTVVPHVGSCALQVLEGTNAAGVLDAAVAKKCIDSWEVRASSTQWGGTLYKLCINGVCDRPGDECLICLNVYAGWLFKANGSEQLHRGLNFGEYSAVAGGSLTYIYDVWSTYGPGCGSVCY